MFDVSNVNDDDDIPTVLLDTEESGKEDKA